MAFDIVSGLVAAMSLTLPPSGQPPPAPSQTPFGTPPIVLLLLLGGGRRSSSTSRWPVKERVKGVKRVPLLASHRPGSRRPGIMPSRHPRPRPRRTAHLPPPRDQARALPKRKNLRAKALPRRWAPQSRRPSQQSRQPSQQNPPKPASTDNSGSAGRPGSTPWRRFSTRRKRLRLRTRFLC